MYFGGGKKVSVSLRTSTLPFVAVELFVFLVRSPLSVCCTCTKKEFLLSRNFSVRGATLIHTRCIIKGIKLGKGKRFLKVSKNQAYSETPGLHLHKGFRKVLARFLCLISHVRPISKIKSGLYILPPVSPPHPAILT